MQKRYLQGLDNDVVSWIDSHADITLAGFDIGGGTPTALTDDAFCMLMNLFSKITGRLKKSLDFEPSIEATFQTVNRNKLEYIRNAGFRRLSLGLQSVTTNVLNKASRTGVSMSEAMRIRAIIKDMGIRKLNLDLMYGLNGMTLSDCRKDVEWIKLLDPEQVTLYEFRHNMVTKKAYANQESKYAQYCVLYEGLLSIGYMAHFGANTFSKDRTDLGVSSYLRSRMCECVPYKGFGISAQSMNGSGISYNIGKGTNNISSLLQNGSFQEEFTYLLPPQEILAKYISISAYFGQFSTEVASRILGVDYLDIFSETIDFLETKGLVSVTPSRISITKEGFKFYGAVFSMLYDS